MKDSTNRALLRLYKVGVLQSLTKLDRIMHAHFEARKGWKDHPSITEADKLRHRGHVYRELLRTEDKLRRLEHAEWIAQGAPNINPFSTGPVAILFNVN